METDPHAARDGAVVLLAVCVVYTLILLIFLGRGYPAAARSVLGLPPEDQYVAQIWYQGPLFFSTTAITAALLVLLSRVGCRPT